MNDIEKPTWEELSDTDKRDTLDLKLSNVLQGILLKTKSRLSSRLLNMARKEVQQNNLITGRQWVKMLYYGVRTTRGTKNLMDINHLNKLAWFGDDKKEKFLDRWEYVWTGMDKHPDDEEKAKIFLKQLRRSYDLAIDIAHYDRLKDGHPDKTFEWLEESCLLYTSPSPRDS